jgi:hypothetical protein
MKKTLIVLFAALVIFAGCYPYPEEEEEPFAPSATTLDENVWADGYLGTADEEQWFKFTASGNLHFAHISLGTINRLRVQFYNSEGKTIGSGKDIEDFSSSIKYISYSSFNTGEEYYIKISPYYYSNDSGTYKIAFNTSATPPVTIKLPSNVTELTVDIPANGNIPSSDGEEWFKFRATAETHYIHVIFGELTDMEVQLYKVKDDIFGDPLGGAIRLSNNGNKYAKPTLTVGDEYYIKITPYNSYRQGTYQIAFNTLFISPTFDITPLTADTWFNDNFPINSKEHWFIFNATSTSTYYIHADFGADGGSFSFQGLDILLYDNSGNMVDSSANLSDSRKYTSRSLTSGQDYYLWVKPKYTTYGGAYKIGFTTSTTPPTLPTP